MSLLVAGLALFFAVHMVPSVAPVRQALIAGAGERVYRAAFSLVTVAGLALIVLGFAAASKEMVYTPPGWGRHAAMAAVPIALVLFAAANMPTHIRAALRHPMLLGLALWALAHLLANGEVRSVALFGTFAAFSVVAIFSAWMRGKRPPADKPPRLMMDAAAVGGGLIVAAVLMHFHGALFGVPIM